jgi:ribosomal protein L15
MPAQETENPASAGISPPEAVDVTALFEQLKEELRKAGADSGKGSQGFAARSQAERTWAVSAERPIERRRGPKGLVAYALKLVLRPYLRWYVEPLAAEQRAFNDAVLKLVDDLDERVGRLEQQR